MDISHVTDQSSSLSRQPLYEVFLSFSGADMRRGFADFLYTMLTDVGISVFRDEEELERSEETFPQPIQVIEQCKISIPVISKEYASSQSCLLELEQMVECMDNKSRIIIPIFYYVDPSDVRNCSGPFERALDEHEKQNCIPPLHRIGELEGHHLHEKSEVSHGEVVRQIVCQVEQMLKKQDLVVPKQLVGVDSHVQGIMAKLKVDYRNGQAVKIGDSSVTVLGIFGIPGVGKTVLAKYVYNQLYHLFDACSFLGEIQAEIDHHGILSVQNNLIPDLDKGNATKFDSSEKALLHIRKNFCTVKVLVLLDDVTNHEQLSALVGELDWLGPGSRVILTSQTQDVLININGAEIFVLEPMKQDEALKLFHRHAFGTDSPPEEYKKLSTDIVAATGRLPLGLEVTGSSLFLVKSKKAWRETLTALEVAPHKRVRAALEKSYNNLDENAQKVFLDIACFFNGMDTRIPHNMWDVCNYSPSTSIQALHARSFVEFGEDEKLLMHEILKKFGMEIVKNGNRDEPSNHKEALHVLKRRKGTEKVKALGLDFGDGSEGNTIFKRDQFDALLNLRYLKLDQADNQGSFSDSLSNLRWLDWRGSSEIFYKQLPDLNLQDMVKLKALNMPDLVNVNLSGSLVDEDSGDWKYLEKAKDLEVLTTYCPQSVATTTFPTSTKLDRLPLEIFSDILPFRPSISYMEKMGFFNMMGCNSLRQIPDLSFTISLEVLSKMKGSSFLYEWPDLGSLTSLQKLTLTYCSDFPVIHSSISYMENLVYLNMEGCSFLYKLPDLGPMRGLEELLIDGTSISRISFPKDSLMKLKILSARNCKNLIEISDSIGYLESLVYLALDGTAILTLPMSIELLKRLNTLSLKNCRRLSNLPDGIGNLKSLQSLELSHTAIQELPPSVKDLKAMKVLRMRDTLIREFPEAILNLEQLEEIDFSLCPILEGGIPDGISRLSSLAILRLTCTGISGLPPSFHRLSHLQELDISGCDRLQSLPELPSSLINVFRD